MGKEREIIAQHMNELKDKAERFVQCLNYLEKEEAEDNDEETKDAWKIILRKHVANIHALLNNVREEIAWSMLDDRTLDFKALIGSLCIALNSYKGFVDEELSLKVGKVNMLIKEGANGFRSAFLSETYYEELFNKETERYRAENASRLDIIYNQDRQDDALNYDENELNNHMMDIRRRELFESRFGKVFHDMGRDIRKVTSHIIDQKEQNYNHIDDFLGKYIALEIAMEYCKTKQEEIYYNNMVFKGNVDFNKVMLKLADYLKDKTISVQRHWFIVYKVFKDKQWLIPRIAQKKFQEQMNSAFYTILKCTEEDFRKVEFYFKNKAYTKWTLEDYDAPQCCQQYKKIADLLDKEFQEKKYALPGTIINTTNPSKFR